MTGKLTYIESKEIRAAELMILSEPVPQLSVTDLKVNGHYASLSAMFNLLHSGYKRKTIGEAPL